MIDNAILTQDTHLQSSINVTFLKILSKRFLELLNYRCIPLFMPWWLCHTLSEMIEFLKQ